MNVKLKLLSALVFALCVTIGTQQQLDYQVNSLGLGAPEDHGWVALESKETAFGAAPASSDTYHGIVRLLYKEFEKATGHIYVPRRQNAPDCVGQAVATAVDFSYAVQVHSGLNMWYDAYTDASSIYGWSRIEIADKSPNAPGGSQVRFAMRAVLDYGTLRQKDYLYAGFNLSQYNPNLSRTWGSQGVPNVLDLVAKRTPVFEYYQVSNYKEVRDAIARGHAVAVGSDVGFSRRTFFSWGDTKATRDKAGFLRHSGVWNHAMCFIGVDDKSRRKGVCCINSWGASWVNGPTKLGNPPGSFWVDDHIVTEMSQQGDSYAIVRVGGPFSYEVL